MVHRSHYLCPYQYHCFRSSSWFLLTKHFCPRVEFALTEWLSSFTEWSIRYSVILWESKVTPEERFRMVLSSVLPAKVKERDRQTDSRWRDVRRYLGFGFLVSGVRGQCFWGKAFWKDWFLSLSEQETLGTTLPDQRLTAGTIAVPSCPPERAKLWVTCNKIKMIFRSRFYSTYNQWTSPSSY